MAVSNKRVFVSFKNDNGIDTSGYFNLIEETPNYIKIRSGSNIITIPYHRLIKMKEAIQ